MITTMNRISNRVYATFACGLALAAVAVAVVALLHGAHPAVVSPTLPVQHFQPIPPIHPLPGATPAEWQTYESAKASYCALVPQATICH